MCAIGALVGLEHFGVVAGGIDLEVLDSQSLEIADQGFELFEQSNITAALCSQDMFLIIDGHLHCPSTRLPDYMCCINTATPCHLAEVRVVNVVSRHRGKSLFHSVNPCYAIYS
ncbi:hypothetical protein D9M73_255660 [compost metagenome]